MFFFLTFLVIRVKTITVLMISRTADRGGGGSSRGNDLVAMKIYSGRLFDPKKNSANLWGVFITKQRYNS